MMDDISSSPFISLIHRKHAKYINELLKDDGLSVGLHPLLIKVYKEDGVSQEDLAHYFYLSESTITRNIKKMEDKGLVVRIKDKRKKIIKITPEGENVAQKIMDYDDKWDEKLKMSLSDEEYEDFMKLLKKISADLI